MKPFTGNTEKQTLFLMLLYSQTHTHTKKKINEGDGELLSPFLFSFYISVFPQTQNVLSLKERSHVPTPSLFQKRMVKCTVQLSTIVLLK